jgi:protein-S-isoprenylcysteine O-methyltransferase Ste14
MLLLVFYAGFGLLLLLGLYALIEIKRTYNKREVLPKRTSVALWILDIVHLFLVILASWNRIWFLPFSDTLSVPTGLVLFSVGTLLILAGMVPFRSLRRISGLEISQLIITGVYRWTRNPQYLGWFLILLGISFIGRSGLAFLLAILGIILFHYYIIRIEEPYLERAFGDKYYQYKSNVPRYIGLHRRRIRKEKNQMVVPVEAKAILVSLIVLVVIAVSIALGYLICVIIGIPSSFGFMLPLRLFGVFVLASGSILLGWLFKFRKPVDILTSTYVTITKVISGVPFDDSSGRTETLVIQGPYKHVRHPLYFDVVVLMVGWWLLLDYSFLLLSAILLLLWFNYVVAPFEEKELKAIFGEQYERYSNEVPRIIPFTKRRNPETQQLSSMHAM